MQKEEFSHLKMLQSYANSSKMSVPPESYSDDDSDYYDQDHDPGREVIEKNIRNRLQRIADYTKDELNKVLKRVDTVRTKSILLLSQSIVFIL